MTARSLLIRVFKIVSAVLQCIAVLVAAAGIIGEDRIVLLGAVAVLLTATTVWLLCDIAQTLRFTAERTIMEPAPGASEVHKVKQAAR